MIIVSKLSTYSKIVIVSYLSNTCNKPQSIFCNHNKDHQGYCPNDQPNKRLYHCICAEKIDFLDIEGRLGRSGPWGGGEHVNSTLFLRLKLI